MKTQLCGHRADVEVIKTPMRHVRIHTTLKYVRGKTDRLAKTLDLE